MWKNEGRHVKELRRIDFCKNKAVVVPNADMPSDEHCGDLVHFTGKVTVDDTTLELSPGSALNVTSPVGNALILKRTCLIYQKSEQAHQEVKKDTIGGGQTVTTTYTVEEDWTPMGPGPEHLPHLTEEYNSRGVWDELIAASGAAESAAPASVPGNMPPEMMALFQVADPTRAPHGISVSHAAHVGGFGLSKEIVMENPGVFLSEWTPLPAEYVSDEVEGLPELRKDRYGNLTTVEEGDRPTNGDVMIKYEYVADRFDASFVVEQIILGSDPETGVSAQKYGVAKAGVIDEKCCGKISDNLGVIWMVRRGRHDLNDMINMAKEDETMTTKILRVVCLALLIAGWAMLFSIFSTLLNTLPILGTLGDFAVFIVALILGCVCFCGVTAVAYIRYRPLLAFGILAVAGTITGICVWRLEDASANSNAPTFAPVTKPSDAFMPDFDTGSDTNVTVEYY
jgi:hypothetical protein